MRIWDVRPEDANQATERLHEVCSSSQLSHRNELHLAKADETASLCIKRRWRTVIARIDPRIDIAPQEQTASTSRTEPASPR